MFSTRTSLTTKSTHYGRTSLAYALLFVAGIFPSVASARVKLEDICTVAGQREVNLVGFGLVTGLSGTGDGPQAYATNQALLRAMEHLHTPVTGDFKMTGKGAALVMLSAKVPRQGASIGQTVDVECSAVFGAEDLHNGILLSSPMAPSDIRSQVAPVIAQGRILVEDKKYAASGVIKGGGLVQVNMFEKEQFARNIFRQNSDPQRGKIFYLLLNPSHATLITAQNVAASINADFADADRYGRQAAKVVGPGNVEVTVPPQYAETPLEFVADVLEVGIDRPHTEARVIINNRSKTVVVTGEASLSPVTIANAGLQVEVGPSFRTLVDPNEPSNNAQLRQLVAALGELQVPTDDVISIIRELHASGKLHAKMMDN